MTVKRQPEAVLRLVHDVAEQIHGAIDDVGGELPFNVQISWDRERGDTSAVTEPKRAILRDLLTDVRLFDSPSEDLYLPTVFEMIRAVGTKPEWHAGLEEAVAQYELHQHNSPTFRFEAKTVAPDGTETSRTISPRYAFDLWVYTEHFHRNAKKHRELDALGPFALPIVRALAHEYLDLLLHEITFVDRVICLGLTKVVVDCDVGASEQHGSDRVMSRRSLSDEM